MSEHDNCAYCAAGVGELEHQPEAERDDIASGEVWPELDEIETPAEELAQGMPSVAVADPVLEELLRQDEEMERKPIRRRRDKQDRGMDPGLFC